MPSTKLGDTHNFGHSVSRVDDWMIKPREVYWEELFLSSESSFRELLNEIIKIDDLNFKALDVFPRLSFSNKEGDSPFKSSKISFLNQDKLELSDFSDENFKKIGVSLAVMAYFGMADLHRENIVLAKNKEQGFIFGPIDIECLFNDFTLISQTRLLPTHDLSLADCGLSSLDFYIREYHLYDKVGLLIEFYLKTIKILSENEERIFNHASITSGMDKKIRVIISSTRKYYESISTKKDVNNFLDEEFEQMDRGDIPYFFRFANKVDEIQYYINKEGEFKAAKLKDDKGDVLKLAIDFDNSPFKKCDSELAINGSLQLLKLLFRERNEFSFKSDYLSINLEDGKLAMSYDSGKKYYCKIPGDVK